MNRITNLFGIQYPIIQGGMVWCSGWRLASAVSNAGGLGLLGAGSMHPDTLREHIRKCRQATDRLFGVNVPLMYPEIEKVMQILVDEGVGYALCLDRLINTQGSSLCFRPLSPALKARGFIVWKKYQVFSKAAGRFLQSVRERISDGTHESSWA